MSLAEVLRRVPATDLDRLVDGYAARLSVRFGRDGFEDQLGLVLADRKITKLQLATIARLIDCAVPRRATKQEMADELIRLHRSAAIGRNRETGETQRLAA